MPIGLDALTQELLRRAWLEAEATMEEMAARVREFKAMKEEMRAALQALREARSEADKFKKLRELQLWTGYFQGWQEKTNQTDQQLTAVLRTMKDVSRIGAGGSDLGSA
jgi:hypothetical protein